MVRHIFMTGVKPGVTSETVDKIILALQEIEGKIPGMSNVYARRNLAWYHDRAQIVIMADCTDREVWDTFVNHPDHVKVAKEYFHMYDQETLVTAQIEL